MSRQARARLWLTCLCVGLVLYVVALATGQKWMVFATTGAELVLAGLLWRTFPPEDNDPPEGENHDQAA